MALPALGRPGGARAPRQDTHALLPRHQTVPSTNAHHTSTAVLDRLIRGERTPSWSSARALAIKSCAARPTARSGTAPTRSPTSRPTPCSANLVDWATSGSPSPSLLVADERNR
ncbi:hypothetical protein QJS66_21920 [Kocuria rhizophila]|nr:hypothetical protein QJS66_21920 [Kocuria rhizophila]